MRRRTRLYTRRSWRGKVKAGPRDQALARGRVATAQPCGPTPCVVPNLLGQDGEGRVCTAC